MVRVEALLQGIWEEYNSFDEEKTAFYWLQCPWDMANNYIEGFVGLKIRVTEENKKIWEGVLGIDPLPHDQIHKFDIGRET